MMVLVRQLLLGPGSRAVRSGAVRSVKGSGWALRTGDGNGRMNVVGVRSFFVGSKGARSSIM